MIRFGSSNGKGAAHHPTRAGHLFRGEVFAWQYGMVLLDALLTIKKDLEADGNENLLSSKLIHLIRVFY